MNEKGTRTFQNYILLGRLRVHKQCRLGWQVEGADVDREDPVIKKPWHKCAHPKCMCINKELLGDQHDRGNFSWKISTTGTSAKCYALIFAAWGANRRN